MSKGRRLTAGVEVEIDWELVNFVMLVKEVLRLPLEVDAANSKITNQNIN